jgi:hypothetical protein
MVSTTFPPLARFPAYQFTPQIVPKSVNAPQTLKNRAVRGLVARIAVI